MAQRLPNPRLAKIHRNYTVEEVARLFGIHRNTVRQWIKQGLRTCDDQRPLLVLGSELADFLKRKRTKHKNPCGPGRIYCVRCRTPQTPALGMADYQPLTSNGGNLVGLTPKFFFNLALRRFGLCPNQIQHDAMPNSLYVLNITCWLRTNSGLA